MADWLWHFILVRLGANLVRFVFLRLVVRR